MVQDHDAIGIEDGVDAMGNRDDRPIFEHGAAQRALEHSVRLDINGRLSPVNGCLSYLSQAWLTVASSSTRILVGVRSARAKDINWRWPEERFEPGSSLQQRSLCTGLRRTHPTDLPVESVSSLTSFVDPGIQSALHPPHMLLQPGMLCIKVSAATPTKHRRQLTHQGRSTGRYRHGHGPGPGCLGRCPQTAPHPGE